jgi:hypothetical protein
LSRQNAGRSANAATPACDQNYFAHSLSPAE